MPSYYFNLFDDIVAIDEEGMQLPNAEAAKLQAIYSARSLICEQIMHGYLVLSHWIDVTDEHGEKIFTVQFRDAFTIRD